MKYRMKLTPGVNLALQQDVPKIGHYYDEALGSHPDCMAVVDDKGTVFGYNFYDFPEAYLKDGKLQMPVSDPDHLVQVEGREPMTLTALLTQLAAEVHAVS